MEKNQPKMIMIRNLKQRTHIFGAVHVHPDDEKTGKPDHKQQPICLHAAETLNPGGEIKMTASQFKFYDDEAFKRAVEEREFAVLDFDGKDIRPDLAKKDKPEPKALKATESAETQESSVLAEIMADNAPKAGA